MAFKFIGLYWEQQETQNERFTTFFGSESKP